MQDFLDFLSWLGFTILAAAVFGFSGVLGTTGLTGPELMTLGLCVSFAGGSSAFLLCRGWVAEQLNCQAGLGNPHPTGKAWVPPCLSEHKT